MRLAVDSNTELPGSGTRCPITSRKRQRWDLSKPGWRNGNSTKLFRTLNFENYHALPNTYPTNRTLSIYIYMLLYVCMCIFCISFCIYLCTYYVYILYIAAYIPCIYYLYILHISYILLIYGLHSTSCIRHMYSCRGHSMYRTSQVLRHQQSLMHEKDRLRPCVSVYNKQ